MKTKEQQKFADLVVEEGRKGNVVFMGPEGPLVAKLDDFIKQPADGILYDLNRLGEVALTFIDDPKWVNDYAVGLVITKLKADLDAALTPAASDDAPVCPSCERPLSDGYCLHDDCPRTHRA